MTTTWKPSEQYQQRATELARLRQSKSLLKHGTYLWMHLPAIELIEKRIKELETKNHPQQAESV